MDEFKEGVVVKLDVVQPNCYLTFYFRNNGTVPVSLHVKLEGTGLDS